MDTRTRNQKFEHKGSFGAQKQQAGTKASRAQELLRAYAEKKKKMAPPEPMPPASLESTDK